MAVNAKTFLEEYQGLLSKKEATVTIDPENKFDRRLALRVAMKGKTPDDYFSIVGGLIDMDYEGIEQIAGIDLIGIAGLVMGLGEEQGIDWA